MITAHTLLAKLDTMAPTFLRVGVAGVFLYFGISQITGPEAWVTWIPDFVLEYSPVSDVALIQINAVYEIVAGTMLLVNWHRRLAALLRGGHLLHIALMMNFGPLMVRDLGLTVATLYLAMKKTP